MPDRRAVRAQSVLRIHLDLLMSLNLFNISEAQLTIESACFRLFPLNSVVLIISFERRVDQVSSPNSFFHVVARNHVKSLNFSIPMK